MTHSDDASRENAALRERIAALNAASQRISASLDLDTVLAEVIQSARSLTGARYGVIAVVDKARASPDFAFSGFTPEEERELAAQPDSSRLVAQLRDLPGPLRLADRSGYVRSLGFEPVPTFESTLLAVPMHHRSAQVGHFFLAGKADGEEFSDDDEEVLKLVASQAAAAIASAPWPVSPPCGCGR